MPRDGSGSLQHGRHLADIEEWLGGKFGRDGAKELRAEMVQNFKIGAAAKVWALDDVPPPEKEGTLDGAGAWTLECERRQSFGRGLAPLSANAKSSKSRPRPGPP